MILIFGGTTEGRVAAEVCDKASKPYLYSTKDGAQKILSSYAEQIYGAMETEQIVELSRDRGVDLIIDAAHPYAQRLHQNIVAAAEQLSLPLIRYDRLSQETNYKNIIYFGDLSEAVDHIVSSGLQSVLALTGVKSAEALSSIAQSSDITLRIMDREESAAMLEEAGFPIDRVIYYNFGGRDDIETCKDLGIKAILTKESGESGGFEAKVSAARELDIPLLVIRRPETTKCDAKVFGPFGLRREIERLLPAYFELRTGFTTGSAATAATVAALKSLLSGEKPDTIQIRLPNREIIYIDIESVTEAGDAVQSCVIKDAGDDPDVTHRLKFVSTVRLLPERSGEIIVRGGVGVGVVTLAGVGLEIGEAAINPVPQRMIRENVTQLLEAMGRRDVGVDIEISVPDGEQVAQKTFNPRLGIVGGISILGTSGIVQPFSLEAFLEAIERQVAIVKAMGHNTIAINSGAMSERYIKTHYAGLPSECYIHYGNLIGATIELASRCAIEHIVLGVMIGKAVKLAAGEMDTHSKRATMDLDFISSLAVEAQCSATTISKINKINTARELWSVVPPTEHTLFDLIAQRCYDHCKPLLPNGRLELILIGESGDIEVVVS